MPARDSGENGGVLTFGAQGRGAESARIETVFSSESPCLWDMLGAGLSVSAELPRTVGATCQAQGKKAAVLLEPRVRVNLEGERSSLLTGRRCLPFGRGRLGGQDTTYHIAVIREHRRGFDRWSRHRRRSEMCRTSLISQQRMISGSRTGARS